MHDITKTDDAEGLAEFQESSRCRDGMNRGSGVINLRETAKSGQRSGPGQSARPGPIRGGRVALRRNWLHSLDEGVPIPTV
jgi:hypothetical protein